MSVSTRQAHDDEIVDVSIQRLVLAAKQGLSTGIGDALEDGHVVQSMQEASAVKLTLPDRDYEALQSGIFGTKRIEVKIDKVPFWLVQVSLVDTELLELHFEHMLIAQMREHNSLLKASRGSTTRAEFIYRMVREIRGPFSFISPELHKRQKVKPFKESESERESTLESHDRQPGLSKENLKIKHKAMNATQASVLSEALQTADEHPGPTLAVEALVVALIQESSCENLDHGTGTSKGALQVLASTAAGIKSATGHGHLDPMNVVECVAHFLTAGFTGAGGANALARAKPHAAPHQIGSLVEGPENLYPSSWNAEAKAVVEAWAGGSGSGFFAGGASSHPANTVKTAVYDFTRGKPEQKEDTYTAAQRLASEVLWRFFVVGRKSIYFVSDDDLKRARPRYLISPDTVGVQKLTFDVEVGKRTVLVKGRRQPKPSEAQLTVRIDRWAAPPGTVIEVADYGPADGRWIVDSVERGLFDAEGTINLRAPQKPLLEPAHEIKTKNLGGGSEGSDAVEAKLKREHPELHPGIRKVVAAILTTYPHLTITSTTNHSRLTTSGNVSLHSLGRACDLAGANMDSIGEWITHELGSELTEGIHNPTLSIKDGKGVDPSFWAQAWAEHKNHIHVAV